MNITRTEPISGDAGKNKRTDAILQSRFEALTHPELTVGAKVLFCFILDLSLDRDASNDVGVVTISRRKLAWYLACSEKSVGNWKKALAAARFIWISLKFRPNTWPMDRFHISALDHPDRPRQLLDQDGLWGNGKLRSVPDRSITARGTNGKFCRGPEPASLPDSPDFTVDHGKNLPASTVNSAVDHGKIYRGQRHDLPLPTVKNAVSPRHDLPLATAKNDREPRQKTALLRETEQGAVSTVGSRSSKRLGNRAGAAGDNRANRPKGWQRRDTQEFLSKCREVLGEKEVQKNSGLWVENLHADPAYAWKTIHDTASAKTEGRIKTTPARYATNVWTKELLGPRKETACV